LTKRTNATDFEFLPTTAVVGFLLNICNAACSMSSARRMRTEAPTHSGSQPQAADSGSESASHYRSPVAYRGTAQKREDHDVFGTTGAVSEDVVHRYIEKTGDEASVRDSLPGQVTRGTLAVSFR